MQRLDPVRARRSDPADQPRPGSTLSAAQVRRLRSRGWARWDNQSDARWWNAKVAEYAYPAWDALKLEEEWDAGDERARYLLGSAEERGLAP